MNILTCAGRGRRLQTPMITPPPSAASEYAVSSIIEDLKLESNKKLS